MCIAHWLLKGLMKGYILGPFNAETVPFPIAIFAPIFTVLKPDLTKRIINHQSYPKSGVSLNDMIDEASKRVEYIKFTEIVEFIYILNNKL